jgi:glyoxylase-like metal-dependent hydrolase (beta-lactamase superfamily II)/rhodanese-related sulfurtransferase
MVELVPVVDEGLGNASYVLELGDGRAAVVDPQRDPRPYLEHARRRGLRVAFAIETHVHADFVTGSRELAGEGAQIVAAAEAGVRYRHVGVVDGQRLDLGGLVLEAVATPGHTGEHVAWLLRDGDTPVGVFTGGSLVVGGVARTDLAGADQTERLARAAYRSLTDRLLSLPDELPVWPTHGPGSFCSTDAAGERMSTIGRERSTNPLLVGNPDEDTFVARLLGGLGSYPTYFDRLPVYNRAGPRVYGDAWPTLPALEPAGVRRAVGDGAQLVDVRPIDRFAAGHVPGALSIELRPQFASWLGWLVDPDRPVVFVTDVDTNRGELVRQCLTIGFENLAGELADGIPAWRAADLPEARIPLINVHDLDAAGEPTILDVRQDGEWRSGHIPNAVHVELGALPDRDVPGGPVVTMCAHGQRSMTAASLLARRRDSAAGLAVYTDSAQAWSDRAGCRLAEG